MNHHHHDKIHLSIGRKLKLLRMFPYKKLTTVAIETGIDKAVLSKIENGKYPSLSIDIAATLCEYYNIPISRLISEDNNVPTFFST